jgi:hypothetical protein
MGRVPLSDFIVLPRKRILASSLDCFKILAKTAENSTDIGKTTQPIEKQAKTCEKYRRAGKGESRHLPYTKRRFCGTIILKSDESRLGAEMCA